MAERVELVGFSDEEGVRFKVGLLGSLALVGEVDVGRLRGGQDWKGVPVPQVLASAGRDIDRLSEAEQHPHSVKAFIVLYIEQGPRMEADRIDLSVVSGLVGVHRQQT